ncbi:hypothetical protein [Winogradskyella thalassocola]|uniref:hypothetical protein n=1 Tax=Winogradskyella thalassocola TaxID=262004 RepID=UPI000B814087|nr:hypothetical protein [Winogradskyella thalassocola]
MRRLLLALRIVILLIAVSVLSCGSSKPQPVKTNTNTAVKRDVETNWKAFKTKSETALKKNESTINDFEKVFSQLGIQSINEVNKELALIKKQKDILQNRLTKRSQDFKEKRIKFHKVAKAKEQEFEAKFNRDMKALEKALKELIKTKHYENTNFILNHNRIYGRNIFNKLWRRFKKRYKSCKRRYDRSWKRLK